MTLCADQQRVLLTFDKDFGEIVFRRGLSAASGVVLFRITPESPDDAAALALALVESHPILKALSASSLVIGFGSDGWARIGRPKTREPLHYKDTLFFVLHKESERRIRPRVCARHVVVQMRGPQRPRTAWPLPDLAGYGPFEVQPRMEDRVGSKCGPRRRRGSLLFLVRLAASD